MSDHILIIEDNEQNLYLATFLLEQEGFVVRSARDGVAGIAEATANVPALIILDIQLPSMDGYAVARRLRSHDQLARVPIVAVTSYAMPGDKAKADAAGCTGYIEKPIDPMTFVDLMRGHLTD